MLTLDGARIAAITSFITRTAEPAAEDGVERWPTLAQDDGRLERVFARSGLPISLR